MMTSELRPYPHPGKYEGELMIAVVLHELSQVGCDEEHGSVDEGGWYGLLRGPFHHAGSFVDITPQMIAEHELNDEELQYLASIAGVILSESSDGFVSVEYFDTETELDAAWAELTEERS